MKFLIAAISSILLVACGPRAKSDDNCTASIDVESVSNEPELATATFEIFSEDCERCKGEFAYTAVYEEKATGKQREKRWNHAWDPTNGPTFEVKDQRSIGESEELADAKDPDVISCVRVK